MIAQGRHAHAVSQPPRPDRQHPLRGGACGAAGDGFVGSGGDNVVTRLGATETGDAGGPGAPESVTVDLPSGCHGLVVVSKAGNGTYTLTKS
ncbi:hypothetical protein [Streptomyces sp. NPDC056227]|uniref:hypothetical protein n=1 Tax=Streptomyces sp. NPDC056227 TaxID=3345753 RepID=UPI0035D9E102